MIALALIKYYINVYVDMLHQLHGKNNNDFDIKDEEVTVMEQVDQAIVESLLMVTLQTYILKKLKQVMVLSTSLLKAFISEHLVPKY